MMTKVQADGLLSVNVSELMAEFCIRRSPVAAFAAVSGHEAERVAGFFEA